MTLSSFKQSQQAQKPHYLLFGNPIEHSWSPLMHNTALQYYGIDARYHAVELKNKGLNSLAAYLNSETFLGANITVPYKQIIIDYLDKVDSTARDIGAVNTIAKQNYKLQGYNTDCAGFLAPLEEYSWELDNGRAIIFGTGGASRAIVAGLKDFGMQEIYLVSRNPNNKSPFTDLNRIRTISYDEWTSYAGDTALIVNATPLGMHPNVGQSPVRESEKESLDNSICYDIVYNPMETTFLKQAKSVGAATIGGLEMLIQQGSESFKIWTGRPFPIEEVKARLHEELTN